MIPVSYEAAARFAQQGGTIYFALMFAAGVTYALWPRHGATFKQLAALPLEDSEDQHVGS